MAYVRPDVEQKVLRMGRGHLVRYEYRQAGVLVADVFTLASIGDVLGLSKPTLETRYKRGRLSAWVVNIPTGYSRPVRGFPTFRLEGVIHVLSTRGAYVQAEGPGAEKLLVGGREPKRLVRGPLNPVVIGGRPFYTIGVLAEYTGLGKSTLRKRLERADLLRAMVSLPPSDMGGRPRKAFTHEQLDDVLMMIDDPIPQGDMLAVQVDRELAAYEGRKEPEHDTTEPEAFGIPDNLPAPDQTTTQSQPEDAFAEIDRALGQPQH